jgi:DNA-binding transcriptional MerR regulator
LNKDVTVNEWRIDELARRAEVAVDTIRYYQREGLVPAGERSGRSCLYGPRHLEQLERIRTLQSRRFSLAAIRVLLDHEVPGSLEVLLAGPEDATYDAEELVAAAAVPAELAVRLAEVGLLREPTEHGRAAYDADDVNVLRAFADLRRLAVPDPILVEMARIYADGLGAIQRQLDKLFDSSIGTCWTPEAVEDFYARAAPETTRFAHAVRVVADYTQHRNFQQVVLHRVAEHGAEHPPPTR